MARLGGFVTLTILTATVAVSKKGKPLVFTEEHINNVVIGHNHLRTHNATPVASDMRKITWDEELAGISSRWSSECMYEMNPNAVTKRWRELGQSFYMSKRGTKWEKDFHFIALVKWLWQQRNYQYEEQKCKDDTFCLEYMNLMAANTYKVGCGASTCPEMRPSDPEEGDPIFYTCIYGPKGNFNSSHMARPYSAGDPCTACGGNDTCQMNVCANEARDSPYIHIEDTVDETPASGPLAGAAAALAIVIGIISSVLVYLKKFRKILPDTSAASGTPSTELRERAESGDGNSRPATPVMEAKFREAEVNSTLPQPETSNTFPSQVATVAPLLEADNNRMEIPDTSSKPKIEPLVEVEEPGLEFQETSMPRLEPLENARNVNNTDLAQNEKLENQAPENDLK